MGAGAAHERGAGREEERWRDRAPTDDSGGDAAEGSAACLEAPASDAWARDSRGREWSAELGRSQGQPRRWCCFYLRMADVPDFDLVPMIIGRGGRNTRDIAAAADAKVRVRGQGSGHLEVTTRREAPTPLMLVVATESDNRSGFHLAVRMATDLLRSVELRYSRHCASRGVEPASPAFALGPMSDALYAELGRALGERLPPRVSDEMELQATPAR